MPNAEAGNLPTVKSLIRTHGNPNKVPGGMVSHIVQLHIAASAKHLQAIMMLCLNWEASFPTESINGNAEGKQQIIVGATKQTNHLGSDCSLLAITGTK